MLLIILCWYLLYILHGHVACLHVYTKMGHYCKRCCHIAANFMSCIYTIYIILICHLHWFLKVNNRGKRSSDEHCTCAPHTEWMSIKIYSVQGILTCTFLKMCMWKSYESCVLLGIYFPVLLHFISNRGINL